MLGLYVMMIVIILALLNVDVWFILGCVMGIVIVKDIIVAKELMKRK